MSSSSPPSQTSSSSRRRDRTDPFQDAKDAIENKDNMNSDARFSLLSGALISLSENKKIELLDLSITAGWISGMNFVLSGISLASIEQWHYSFWVLGERAVLKEDEIVEIFKSFREKGCNLVRYRECSEADRGNFAFFGNVSESKYVFNPKMTNAELTVSLVQELVQNDFSCVLELLLPDLDQADIYSGLIEAISINSQRCCDVLLKSTHSETEFPLCLCAVYGRSNLLKRLLENASPDLIKDMATTSLPGLDLIAPFPIGTPEKNNILELAIYCNNPDCASLIFKYIFAGVVAQPFIMALLVFSCRNNHIESAKVLIDNCTYDAKDESIESPLVEVLHEALRFNSPLVIPLVRKMKKTVGCKTCLDSILGKCFENRWFDGLFTVATHGIHNLIDMSDEGLKDAQRTLTSLIRHDFGERCEQIIKCLALIPGLADHDLSGSFFNLTMISENEELVEFFLSLNNDSIKEECIRIVEDVVNQNIRKMLENAIAGVKLEALE